MCDFVDVAILRSLAESMRGMVIGDQDDPPPDGVIDAMEFLLKAATEIESLRVTVKEWCAAVDAIILGDMSDDPKDKQMANALRGYLLRQKKPDSQ